ncbi:MAG: hypothetical protein HOO92_01995 [Methylococcaceae bacterium]|nr:hypothetical protein [Methylococcaceae bacterium]
MYITFPKMLNFDKLTQLNAGLLFALFLPACVPIKPYAQNPFNPTAKLASSEADVQRGKISDSTAFKAGSVAIAASTQSIPGALPSGAGVGVAVAGLLVNSGSSRPLNYADNSNYLTIGMPISEATDEDEAQIKMGALVEHAIIKALGQDYQTNIVEYDDHYAFGRIHRPRWLLVNGPLCQNWSCQALGPIPTKNALQWEGKIQKNITDGKSYYIYPPLDRQIIGLVKIQNDYIKETLTDSYRVLEGIELQNFNYEEFFRRISENLPDWVDYHIAISSPVPKYPYVLNKGLIIQH